MHERFGYLFVFGAGPYRAYVYSMRRTDGPFRMEVTSESGATSSFYGLSSAERCVESAATFLRSQGVQIPPGVVRDWQEKAAKVDRARAPAPSGGWS